MEHPGGDVLKESPGGDGLKENPECDGPERGGLKSSPECDGLEGGLGGNGLEGGLGGNGPEGWPGGDRPQGGPRGGGTEGMPRDCGLRGSSGSEHKCDGRLVGLGEDCQECHSESNSSGDTLRTDLPKGSLEINLPTVSRDTMEQLEGIAMVQKKRKVAASLDNASQRVLTSEDGATAECEGATCSPSKTTVSSAFHGHTDSDSSDTSAEGSDDGLGRIGVEMTDRKIDTLLFDHRPISSPSTSRTGQVSNSPNDMQETRGRYIASTSTRQQNVRKNGIQSLRHGENIPTEGLPVNIERAAAIEPCGNGSDEGPANDRSNETRAYAGLASGSNEGVVIEGEARWIPDPRIERRHSNEIPRLHRPMRPSRRPRKRQRVEEMSSLYVVVVLSENEKLKMEDLPSCEITAQYFGTKCSICLVEYELKENVCKLQCGHLFHKKCIMLWLREDSSCPLCRKPFKDPATSHGNVRGRRGNFGDPENLSLSSQIQSIVPGTQIALVARNGDDDSSSSSSSESSESSDTESSPDTISSSSSSESSDTETSDDSACSM